MIRYAVDAAAIGAVTANDLAPFFVGWPVPPSPERRLAALRGADHVVLAFDGERLVGFATALSDGVLMSSLSLLEVVPGHRGRGIGTELVRLIRDAGVGVYGLDAVCDEDVVGFYEHAGFHHVHGMVLRDRAALP